MNSYEQFSGQERRVIELLLKGKSNKQMAVLLGISARTIEFHLSNVYKKLKVSSRTEAVLKLSEGYPRESTGADPSRKSVVSTVAKTGKLAKNGDNKNQLWRQRMPYALYILITLGLLLFLLGVGRPKLDTSKNPVTGTVVQQPIATTTPFATATEIQRSSPVALHSPTVPPTLPSSPTVVPTATATAVSSASSGDTCKGPMPARPAGPKANISFMNATKANITISLFLSKNKFGDCGYSSYTLTRLSSISVEDVLPYGCYYTYAIINDPKNPTHVISGPDCITGSEKIIFTVTYNTVKISPGP
jgi:DNA-binding CsgD family transcriptional regulator